MGLTLLDEPSVSRQSDPSLLALRLRAASKRLPLMPEALQVRTASSPKDIDDWIASLHALHRETQGTPSLHSLRLPDIEKSMQEWDPDFEEALARVSLPTPDLQVDLPDYVSLLSALLDIPVHGSLVASLHHLFSLYNEFRSSQHFRHIE